MGKKISELASASALTGSEVFAIVQTGKTRKLTLDNIVTHVATSNGFTFVDTDNMYAGTGAMASLAGGNFNHAVGIDALNALTSGFYNTAFGYRALIVTETTSRNTGIGASAGANNVGEDNTFIGYSADGETGSYNIAIGASASVANFSKSIAIGCLATATANSQLVIGNVTYEITEAYIGEGVTSASPGNILLSGTGGSGTDIAGGNFSYSPGKATGNAAGGYHDWLTSDAGASGTTLQTNTSKMRLINAGRLGIGVTSPTGVLHLKAGTATASTAPLKFTSGTNLTTAEAGAMEYNGTNLFFTRTGTTRQTVLTANVVTTEVIASDTSVTVNIAGVDYKLLARA